MGRFFKIVRFFFGLILVVVIIRKVDYEPLRAIMKDIRIEYCLAVLGVFYLQDIIKALKWQTLLLVKNINLTILKIIQVDLASSFLSLFVPSTISLDLFRAYGLSKEITTKKLAASSIIMDRVLSLLALLVVANLSIALFYENIRMPDVAYISVSLLVIFVVTVVILNSQIFIGYLNRHEEFFKKYSILQKLNDLRQSIHEYKLYKSKLTKVFLLSIMMQILRIVVYYLASLAVQADIPFTYFMIFTPIVMFLVMLPISFAGIGLREGSFVYFFTQIGVAAPTAFAIPALVSLVLIVSVLPGGFIIAFKGLALKKETMSIKESTITT